MPNLRSAVVHYLWILGWLLCFSILVAPAPWYENGLIPIPLYAILGIFAFAIRISCLGIRHPYLRIKRAIRNAILFLIIAEVIFEVSLTLKGRNLAESYAATVLVNLFGVDLPTIILSAFFAAVPVRILDEG